MDATQPVAPPRTTCAVVGGGPAGLVLGLLLARAGVEVTVLEKHADFLRDFRGDTVHPTTLGLLDDLGLFDRFDALPQTRMRRGVFPVDGREIVLADFGRLPLRHPYIAMVPQWDLLDLLAEDASSEPTFTLLTEHEVTGVVRDRERVIGIDYTTPSGNGRLLTDLVVACDGRWSVVRHEVGLPTTEYPVDFDVWWFRLPTDRRVGESLLPRVGQGRAMIAIPREGYLQIAYLGAKGEDAALRARGIEAFRADVTALLPEAAQDVAKISSMDDVKHLDVRLDRLRRWYAPGVLCIGDAAHAMSPIGGVGINLAVQDAVATARLLAEPLRRGDFAGTGAKSLVLLRRLQRRRTFPTAAIQAMQGWLDANFVRPTLQGKITAPPRQLLETFDRLPVLAALPALLIGVGPRPERAPTWARRSTR